MRRHTKIVLPCRNEREWLRATVDSILETTDFDSYEVMVLANGDTQTDFGFIDEPAYQKKVKLKVVGEALGVGRSVNAAVAPGDASHYVFLDAHCLIEQKDWLHRMVDCLETHPEASMVQPEVRQFSYRGALEPEGRPDASRIQDEGRAYSITWSWPYSRPTDTARVTPHPEVEHPYEAMAGGGMCVFVRADTFHRLGCYDPEVSGWYPETMDYCVRAWMLGFPMIVDPGIRIHHRVSEGSVATRHLRNVIHGVLRTAFKYLSPRRRDLAESLYRTHGLGSEVDDALSRIHRGRWLEERVEHLRARVHDDDWLFSRFDVYEARYAIHE